MKYKLNVEVSFTDKYTNETYNIGDLLTVDEARGKELLADSRNLVSLNDKIETEEVETEQKKKDKSKK